MSKTISFRYDTTTISTVLDIYPNGIIEGTFETEGYTNWRLKNHTKEAKSAISNAHKNMKKYWQYKPITLEKNGEVKSFKSQLEACETLNLSTGHVSEMVNKKGRKSVKGWRVVQG